jgi:branched-chain amino acid transport system permease protein
MKKIILNKMTFKPSSLQALIMLILAVLFITLMKDTFFLHIGILVFMYIGLSSSWNIISGYCGYLSLGHAAYFGLGGYVAGILYIRFGLTPWVGMLAGGIFTALIAVFAGYPSLRLRGAFYTLVTIAFVQVVRIVAVNWVALTGGSQGLHIPFEQNFVNMMFFSRNAYALLFLCYAVVTVVISWKIDRSKLGYYLIAIRENQESAEALGINSPKYKSIALGISAFMTSIGGSLYAFYVVSIEPADIFSMSISTMIAVVSIVGSLGMVGGPVVGALIIIPLNELLRAYVGSGVLSGMNLLIYGLILIVFALKYPNGIYFYLSKFLKKFLVVPVEGTKEEVE